jgi:hypothetical protein
VLGTFIDVFFILEESPLWSSSLQGCQIGFLKPDSRNLAFLKFGWSHKIFLAFTWRFYMLKLSARK